jgi:hypothetical protein
MIKIKKMQQERRGEQAESIKTLQQPPSEFEYGGCGNGGANGHYRVDGECYKSAGGLIDVMAWWWFNMGISIS